MGPISIELKPDRHLLDPKFEGYKLSLQEIPTFRQNLDVPIDPSHLTASQYSLLHTKLFGLHNYLFGDRYSDSEAVYFVDKEFNVCKIYVDALGNDLVKPVRVWKIPGVRERKTGDYGITLKFPSKNLAVLSDGMGSLYILDTKERDGDSEFDQLYSGEVIGNQEQGFAIFDAVYLEERQELHVLIVHIAEDLKDRFVSVIHWVTFRQHIEGKKAWNQVSLRQLKTKGEVQYLHFETGCENIYIVSDSDVKFVLNSEYPITEDNEQEICIQKSYKWSQNVDEISVKFPLPENPNKSLVKVSTESTKIDVVYDSKTLLRGDFAAKIEASLTTWKVGDDNILEITLNKVEGAQLWPELVVGDQNGEYVLDPSLTEEVKQRLGNITSDTESLPQSGTTFNSQQVEECDFESDKSVTFERFNGTTSKCVHKIHLGSHQVLLSTEMSPGIPPALGIRHDVDICLWQPNRNEESFEVKHVGTLLAFGYVQASKQNRKFTVCAPDLNYSIVSESTGHIFIYKQHQPLISSELRHRTSGQRIKTVAQQQVVNLANQQILGVQAGNTYLYLLGEDFIIALLIGSIS